MIKLVSKDTRFVYNRHRQGISTSDEKAVFEKIGEVASERPEKSPAFSRLRSPATYLMAVCMEPAHTHAQTSGSLGLAALFVVRSGQMQSEAIGCNQMRSDAIRW